MVYTGGTMELKQNADEIIEKINKLAAEINKAQAELLMLQGEYRAINKLIEAKPEEAKSE